MDEEPLRDEFISFDGFFQIIRMNTNSNSHQQMLRPFDNYIVDFEQITSFQRFETKVVENKISFVVYFRSVQPCSTLQHSFGQIKTHLLRPRASIFLFLGGCRLVFQKYLWVNLSKYSRLFYAIRTIEYARHINKNSVYLWFWIEVIFFLFFVFKQKLPVVSY